MLHKCKINLCLINALRVKCGKLPTNYGRYWCGIPASTCVVVAYAPTREKKKQKQKTKKMKVHYGLRAREDEEKRTRVVSEIVSSRPFRRCMRPIWMHGACVCVRVCGLGRWRKNPGVFALNLPVLSNRTSPFASKLPSSYLPLFSRRRFVDTVEQQ